MRSLTTITLCLLLAACATAPSPSTTPTAAAPSPGVTPAAEPTDDLDDFTCNLPFAGEGAGGIAHVTDIRVARHEGFDWLVLQFDSGVPEIQFQQAVPPLTTDPAGLPLAVEGNVFVSMTLRGASRGGMDGPVTYEGPTDFSLASNSIVQVRMAGDFEAVMTFIIGLTAPPCYRIFPLSDPARLVLDIEHPAG